MVTASGTIRMRLIEFSGRYKYFLVHKTVESVGFEQLESVLTAWSFIHPTKDLKDFSKPFGEANYFWINNRTSVLFYGPECAIALLRKLQCGPRPAKCFETGSKRRLSSRSKLRPFPVQFFSLKMCKVKLPSKKANWVYNLYRFKSR